MLVASPGTHHLMVDPSTISSDLKSEMNLVFSFPESGTNDVRTTRGLNAGRMVAHTRDNEYRDTQIYVIESVYINLSIPVLYAMGATIVNAALT
jgi:hypothetical protein